MSDCKNKYKVRFEPDNVEIVVEEGANLLEAAIAAGVHINAGCGGNGTCGTCNVLLKQGRVLSKRTDRVSMTDYAMGVRQSCQTKVMSDLIVEILSGSRLEKAVLEREQQKVSAHGQMLADGWRFSPPVEKRFLELVPPTLEDNASDLSRLLRCLDKTCGKTEVDVDFRMVRKLANVARQAGWRITTTLLEDDGHAQAYKHRTGRYPQQQLFTGLRYRHHGGARTIARPEPRQHPGTGNRL